jgi:hypothetical protein
MRYFLLTCIAICILLLCTYSVILYLPAKYITDYLHEVSAGKLHFTQTSGTVINGITNVGLAYASKDEKPMMLATPLTWQADVNILPLRINIKIQHLNLAQPLVIDVLQKKVSALYIQDLPLSFFSGLKGPLFSLNLMGSMRLALPEFTLDQSSINFAHTAIYLDNVYRKDLPNFILGSYELKVDSNGKNFSLSTNIKKSNILHIQGAGNLTPFNFSGEAVSNPLFAAHLAPFLSSVGYIKNGKTYIAF